MRENNAIQMIHFFAEHLISEIGTGIDHECSFCRSYEYTGAKAFVLFIRRLTNGTVATDHRYTTTGAGA